MTDFVFNGVHMNHDEFMDALNASQEYMVHEEEAIKNSYEVSQNTAAAILYLRSRSRWSVEKEMELVYRDREGNPISLGKVLSGEF